MDASAIKHIQESQAATQGLAVIHNHAHVTALPKEFMLHDLESFTNAPRRFCGTYTTDNLPGYVDYVDEHKQETTTCFADTETMVASTIFTLGSMDAPAFRAHTAILKLQRTAAYSALLKIQIETLDQQTLAHWLQDWSDHITVLDEDAKTIDTKDAIRAIRKLTIKAKANHEHDVQERRAQRSHMESIAVEADGAEPHFVKFTSNPYHHLPRREFLLRVRVFAERESPLLTLRLINAERHQEEMGQEFRQLMLQNLPAEINCHIGKFIG